MASHTTLQELRDLELPRRTSFVSFTSTRPHAHGAGVFTADYTLSMAEDPDETFAGMAKHPRLRQHPLSKIPLQAALPCILAIVMVIFLCSSAQRRTSHVLTLDRRLAAGKRSPPENPLSCVETEEETPSTSSAPPPPPEEKAEPPKKRWKRMALEEKGAGEGPPPGPSTQPGPALPPEHPVHAGPQAEEGPLDLSMHPPRHLGPPGPPAPSRVQPQPVDLSGGPAPDPELLDLSMPRLPPPGQVQVPTVQYSFLADLLAPLPPSMPPPPQPPQQQPGADLHAAFRGFHPQAPSAPSPQVEPEAPALGLVSWLSTITLPKFPQDTDTEEEPPAAAPESPAHQETQAELDPGERPSGLATAEAPGAASVEGAAAAAGVDDPGEGTSGGAAAPRRPSLRPEEHPYYRVAALGPGVTPWPINFTAAGSAAVAQSRGITPLRTIRYLLKKTELTQFDVSELVYCLEKILSHCLHFQGSELTGLDAHVAVINLGTKFLLLDGILAAFSVLKYDVPVDFWARLVDAMPHRYIGDEPERRAVPRHEALMAMAFQLSDAVARLKTGRRLSPEETLKIKTMLFCNEKESPKVFLRKAYDAWREDCPED